MSITAHESGLLPNRKLQCHCGLLVSWKLSAGTGPEEDDATKDYICGSDKDFPMPLYFIGGFGHGSQTNLSLLANQSPANNIHYLGTAGVRQIHGLNVAFLDGTYNKAAFDAPGTSGEATSCQHYTQVRHPLLQVPAFANGRCCASASGLSTLDSAACGQGMPQRSVA